MASRDETALFLRRLVDRMPPIRLEEMRARGKVESKHTVWDAEVDSVLYECPPEELWAFRPGGEDPRGVDLWEVVGTTDARRPLFLVGRMGGDGLFRLISSRPLTKPGGPDRDRLQEYRRIVEARGAGDQQG